MRENVFGGEMHHATSGCQRCVDMRPKDSVTLKGAAVWTSGCRSTRRSIRHKAPARVAATLAEHAVSAPRERTTKTIERILLTAEQHFPSVTSPVPGRRRMPHGKVAGTSE